MDDNKFGLRSGDLEVIIQTISGFPEIQKAALFGSRAMGTYKAGSDVDIAIWSSDNDTPGRLSGVLNDETLLPYKFDVLNFDKIDNPALREQISRWGVTIYLSPA